MTGLPEYSVVTTGELLPGFAHRQVHDALISRYNILPEQAMRLLEGRQVIKKRVDLETAQTVQRKLEDIGLVAMLQELTAASVFDSGLSLSPMHHDEPTADNSGPGFATSSATIVCPKCQTRQAASAEQCTGCGVYLHKVMKQDTPVTAAQTPASVAANAEADSSDAPARLSGKSLIAGLLAALLGALLWKFVGVTFDRELGIVAWIVGVMIGTAVAATGSRGDATGIICGVLALAAIIGGKYLLYSVSQEEINAALSASSDEMHTMYQEEMDAANDYARVSNDSSLRAFMIKYAYAETDNPQDISREELDDFRQEMDGRLGSYALAKPSYEAWYKMTIGSDLAAISTSDLLVWQFGLVDMLFLFLGVASAFRIGRGKAAS